jgi:hypothetical protein
MPEETTSVFEMILGMFLLAILCSIACAYIFALFGGAKEEARRKANRERRWGKISRSERTPPQIFPSATREKIIRWTDGLCFHCEKNLLENGYGYWEVDHLWPKIFGGVDELYNLVASCQPCNKKKFARNPFVFIVYKWTEGERISNFEMKFLKFYSVNSPTRLTTNPTWIEELQTWRTPIGQLYDDLELDNRARFTDKKRRQLHNKYVNLLSEW